MNVIDHLLVARAAVLRDLEATGATSPASVSALESAVTERRWWVGQWAPGAQYAAGLVAQDVQDAMLADVGRWPLCPVCHEATHALYIHPEIGGPEPRWVCEETGREVAALGGLAELDEGAGPNGPTDSGPA